MEDREALAAWSLLFLMNPSAVWRKAVGLLYVCVDTGYIYRTKMVGYTCVR